MEHALGFESFTTALHFLMTWPAMEQAAVLITKRAAEIDGHHYELLGPASDALEDRHPLAATPKYIRDIYVVFGHNLNPKFRKVEFRY